MVIDNRNSLLIVGSGAMACLFAARLSAVGFPVTMLGSWLAGVEALQQRGVILVESDGSQHNYPVRATTDPGDCPDMLSALVLVKSWQTGRVADQLAVCLSPEGVALSLQNGLGNRETLTHPLGEARVALGTVTIGANLLAPGMVKLAGEGVITLGDHPRLGVINELLKKAGFVVEPSSNLESLLWGKLIINAAINPLTALFEIPNGTLLDNSYAHRTMREVVNEVVTVASVQGIPLPFANAMEAVETVVRKTAENRSSMLQDIQRGAPTEIDAICGAIVLAGKKVGVETPVNRTLWQLIQAKVETCRL